MIRNHLQKILLIDCLVWTGNVLFAQAQDSQSVIITPKEKEVIAQAVKEVPELQQQFDTLFYKYRKVYYPTLSSNF